MLTYTFSKREKALLIFLAVILVAVAWFVLVFQRTSSEISALENDIATTQANTSMANAQVERMHRMQAVVDKYKAAGVKARPVPAFDNMTPLMSELNRIMGMAATYSLSFDDLDSESSTDYILRGVTADFSCSSFSTAEQIVTALATGSFPCSIDSVIINDSTVRSGSRTGGTSANAPVAASVHITFFEKRAGTN